MTPDEIAAIKSRLEPWDDEPCEYKTYPDTCGIPGHEVSMCHDHGGFYEPCPLTTLPADIKTLLAEVLQLQGIVDWYRSGPPTGRY